MKLKDYEKGLGQDKLVPKYTFTLELLGRSFYQKNNW